MNIMVNIFKNDQKRPLCKKDVSRNVEATVHERCVSETQSSKEKPMSKPWGRKPSIMKKTEKEASAAEDEWMVGKVIQYKDTCFLTVWKMVQSKGVSAPNFLFLDCSIGVLIWT